MSRIYSLKRYLMIRLYSISVFLFLITACASNDKVADSNYNNVWIKKVSGKSVMAPNGYLYTFKENIFTKTVI